VCQLAERRGASADDVDDSREAQERDQGQRHRDQAWHPAGLPGDHEEADTERRVEGSQVAGRVHGKPGIGAEQQRGDREGDLHERDDGQAETPRVEVAGRRLVGAAWLTDRGEHPRREVGHGRRGAHPRDAMQARRFGLEAAAGGAPGEVRVQHGGRAAGVLVVEAGRDPDATLLTGDRRFAHARVVDSGVPWVPQYRRRQASRGMHRHGRADAAGVRGA
jgi:hypothetical protein